MTVEAQVTINGTIESVWAVMANIEKASEVLSGVEKIEIVERPATGIRGLKWRETRMLFGKPATVEKVVIAGAENEFFSTESKEAGLVFSTTNLIREREDGILLRSTHQTIPQGFFATLKALPMVFFKGMIKKAILQDLNDIKAEVERAYGPLERVYVENDWYDGPQAGVADINGVPHRFRSIFNEVEDDYSKTFMVWPIDSEMLALEVEQWHIFLTWNALFESGQAKEDSHPGHGGRIARWDEVEVLLKQDRSEVPTGSKRAVLRYVRIERADRYAPDGPDYMLSWRIL